MALIWVSVRWWGFVIRASVGPGRRRCDRSLQRHMGPIVLPPIAAGRRQDVLQSASSSRCIVVGHADDEDSDVSERPGIRTRVRLRNWIGKLPRRVAAEIKADGEPPITSLCVHQDGSIGDGYALAPKTVEGDDGDDIETSTVEHRLLCYRQFAKDVPSDGGKPALTRGVSERRARQ